MSKIIKTRGIGTLEWLEINKIKNESNILDIGEGYIQFAGFPLPGSRLISFEGVDISDTFSLEKLENCKMKGSTWKIAVRNGDFLRQEGTHERTATA